MANGEEHRTAAKRATVGTAVLGTGIIVGVSVWASYQGYVLFDALAAFGRLILFQIGMVLGMVVDPDHDMLQITASEKRKLKKRPYFGRLWLAWWAPYGACFTHRGISHAPVLGTLTRAVCWWWPVGVYVANLVDKGQVKPEWVIAVVVPIFLGWCFQDMVHLAKDGWRFKWKI